MEQFSVLISVYQREKPEFIDAALRSVFEQTVAPMQVVLVEDGPLNEGLYGVISAYKQKYESIFDVVSLEKNTGLGNALNEGLKQCRNELVARMDSDDICKESRFEQQLRAFDEQPDLAIVGGWIEEFVSDPNIVDAQRKLPQTNAELKEFIKSKNPLNHMTVMFRKSAVEAVGGYQHFYLMEDYWLWIRMMKNGAKFYNIQQTLVLVRGGVEMAARRGGLKYAMTEVKLQKELSKMGFIGVGTFVKNVAIRFAVRIMPNKLRSLVYKKIIRR